MWRIKLKLLTTEKQEDLRNFLESVDQHGIVPVTLKSELAYWLLELKPKRVRRNKIDKSNQQGIVNG